MIINKITTTTTTNNNNNNDNTNDNSDNDNTGPFGGPGTRARFYVAHLRALKRRPKYEAHVFPLPYVSCGLKSCAVRIAYLIIMSYMPYHLSSIIYL